MSHLSTLELSLSHERARLSAATSAKEMELRKVYVAQIEKEIAGEKKFLGIVETEVAMSDDDLFNELNA